MTRFLFLTALLPGALLAQTTDPGRAQFEGHCAVCHGRDGHGGELGPAIQTRIGNYSESELTTLIREGLPNSGMPRNDLSDADMRSLVLFLETLKTSAEGVPLSAPPSP